MRSVPGRARRLESAVSICLLAILFLIAIGLLIKQKPKLSQQDELDLSSLTAPGFNASSKTEIYDSGNLYEKINGKAPFYTDSGFKKLFTQRFVSSDDDGVWFEAYLYDMATVRNAFSVYSTQKRADAEILPDLQFGYRTSNALYFAHGKYYIELVGSSESPGLFKAMKVVGRKISSELTVDTVVEIAELNLFPSQNFVQDSVKLYLADAFGFEGLTDTFTAKYEIDGETITAFFSRRPSRRDAKKLAESYYNFLIANGGEAKPAANKILEGKVVSFYGATEIVFSIGPFAAGIHEAENQHTAEKLAVILINKLGDVAKAESDD